MLPQMMPLPWVFVFLLVFVSVFSVSLFISSNPSDRVLPLSVVKPSSLLLLW
uniref:ATP synthase F0 subunit 8 n=1 Tax=Lepidoglyphus destructor TaxID=36936 RepID=A0A8F2WAQ5_LEPDS|nr:ATP synthase F0 subunit 8 [Lepidoglyphus destructor]QWW33369.1 ATP synthase F0 subunit 8 [Lepidoglyphus destructor]UOG85318.1 ATP synthase F0 subunit 8 [Lepidoglyphus destructor]